MAHSQGFFRQKGRNALAYDLTEVNHMNFFRTLYIRTYQLIMRGAAYLVPWRKPKLIEGRGSLSQLPKLVKDKGILSVLIITDNHLKRLGLLDPLFEGLQAQGVRYSVYSDVQPNPTVQNVEAALKMYHQNDCHGIIAFGGGSPIDCAKACGARVIRPNKPVIKMRGLFKVLHRLPALFVVPTTAGTGSETTITAVITEAENHHKITINDIPLMPHYAILDPLLTVGLPPHLTATTGFDALCHAVEAYLNRSNTRQTRQMAREAVRLVFENLFQAYQNGGDLEARENMLKASFLAGAAFTRAYVGYVHAIAHTLGGFYDIPHGLANAVILPKMLEYYGRSVYKPLAELADVVGITGANAMDKAVRLTEAIKSLNKKMAIPNGFSEIKLEEISLMAAYADSEANPLYPVPQLMDKDALAHFIEGLMINVEFKSKFSSYTGKIAWIDLSELKVSDYPLRDEDRRRFLGGKGIAAKILFDNLPADVLPFGPDNLIVITTGPLSGTGAPTSGRYNISTVSPLTGLCVSSNSGGDFGFHMKKCGYDGLVIAGRAERLTNIEITAEGNITFHDAAYLQGKTTGETQAELKKPALVIGPAGENKVLYASVMSSDRAFGRGGVGAVFGDKNLKAVYARGTKKTEVADRESLRKHIQGWNKMLRAHPYTGRIWPDLGTTSLVRPMQKIGILATRNFDLGQFEGYDHISGETLRDKYVVKHSGCIACPIRCSRVVKMGDQEVKAPELETLVLLGSNLMNDDLELIIRLNYLMDEYGMDTMTAGVTLGFAMHLADEGIVDLGLRFGQQDGLEEMVRKIAFREGPGEILAEGTRKMAEKYDAHQKAAHVKGLELAAYNPRRAFGQGLSYATANRGGCHLNGGYLVFLEGLGLSMKQQSTKSKPELAVMFQWLMEAISSAGCCLFTSFTAFPPVLLEKPFLKKITSTVLSLSGPILRPALKNPQILNVNVGLIPYSKAITLATGMPMSLGKLLTIGRDAYELERRLNIRLGLEPAEDRLPETFKEEVPIDNMVEKYYRAAGWS
jgi:aldehyde:ferredoxin oxidoreductase